MHSLVGTLKTKSQRPPSVKFTPEGTLSGPSGQPEAGGTGFTVEMKVQTDATGQRHPGHHQQETLRLSRDLGRRLSPGAAHGRRLVYSTVSQAGGPGTSSSRPPEQSPHASCPGPVPRCSEQTSLIPALEAGPLRSLRVSLLPQVSTSCGTRPSAGWILCSTPPPPRPPTPCKALPLTPDLVLGEQGSPGR